MNEIKCERIIRLRDVIELTGLSKTTIYRLGTDPRSDFPQALELTPGSRGWREKDVLKWLESRKPVGGNA